MGTKKKVSKHVGAYPVEFRSKVVRLHLEEGYNEFLDGKYYTPALISQGNVDTAGVWKAMKEYGYKGFINIEYEGNAIKADKATQIAVDYLHSL